MKKQLDARLEAVFSMMDPAYYYADIGSDHGYLPIRFLRAYPETRMIATEYRKGPFQHLCSHLDEADLLARVRLVLSDGLSQVADQPNALVIAGMGAKTIIHILEADFDRVQKMKQLLLQANTQVPSLRAWLDTHGFIIQDERYVSAQKHGYSVLSTHWVGCEPSLDTLDLAFGPILRRTLPDAYRKALIREMNYLIGHPEVRQQQKRLYMIRTVLGGYQHELKHTESTVI